MGKFVDLVYYSLTGDVEEGYAVPGVENAYAAGGVCDTCYSEAMAAYDRLRTRLGTEDVDADVEDIITNLERIQHYLCQRMYQYGAKFGVS